MKARILKELERDLEGQGLKPRSPEFDRAYRSRKVELCKAMQKVASCWDCKAFDGCSLVKQHLVDLRTPRKKSTNIVDL